MTAEQFNELKELLEALNNSVDDVVELLRPISKSFTDK